MCSILCWILSIREALGCMISFWLDSCVTSKGENCVSNSYHGWDAICITRGECCIMGRKRWILSLGGNLSLHAFVQKDLAFMLWESSLCCLNLCCALLFCRWWRALVPHLEESAFWAFCLGCVESLRTGASEDRWMVAPWCDEWLTTWCGLTLGWDCRCRLRLHLRWRRWRACAKGLSLCVLRGVERQVGSDRWTRWPDGIKCGSHGGKKSKMKPGTVSWLSLKTKVEQV
jgi:hypothetical protein